MKLTRLATAALLGALLLPGLALAETKTINGCEVKASASGGFFNLVDPDCAGNPSDRAEYATRDFARAADRKERQDIYDRTGIVTGPTTDRRDLSTFRN